MYGSYMTHVSRTDTVRISEPTEVSPAGCLKIDGPSSDGLYIFPPSNTADAETFLAALIERATELRDAITNRSALATAAA